MKVKALIWWNPRYLHIETLWYQKIPNFNLSLTEHDEMTLICQLHNHSQIARLESEMSTLHGQQLHCKAMLSWFHGWQSDRCADLRADGIKKLHLFFFFYAFLQHYTLYLLKIPGLQTQPLKNQAKSLPGSARKLSRECLDQFDQSGHHIHISSHL